MKFSSKPIAEHDEVPLADDRQLEEIVEYWTERQGEVAATASAQTRGYVVSVGSERDPVVRRAQLLEIVNLVRAQGGEIAGEEIYRLTAINPRTFFGSGAAREVASRARLSGANLLVLDAELSPSQLRNLEDAAGISVCDREAIILNVFLRNARTRRARIQVEIARLEYLRPRIRGVGINMDQQMGGVRGGRGPGESASELMARKLDGRLTTLTKALRKIERSGETQRSQRDACKRIVLVGYTNAGKTSLMNALTNAGLSARNMPFETLDTTARCLSRQGEEVLLSDTVGFIRRLPERLLVSFESTLAEIREASLLVLVVDAADSERELHLQTTVAMLQKLNAAEIPRYYVFNKVDMLPQGFDLTELRQLTEGYPVAALSSRDVPACAGLKAELLQIVQRDQLSAELLVPYSAVEVMSLVYARCRIVKSIAEENGLRLTISGEARVLEQIKARVEAK